ncbi:MAG: hypothetical protein OXQ86_06640 [Gammaproteobacteria bacterium]|nr:hypothetical protein [Gammaproteobacteria bacterium]MDE0413121.1 hypothetical protein [Gammaproteobacteria bacterium]
MTPDQFAIAHGLEEAGFKDAQEQDMPQRTSTENSLLTSEEFHRLMRRHEVRLQIAVWAGQVLTVLTIFAMLRLMLP